MYLCKQLLKEGEFIIKLFSFFLNYGKTYFHLKETGIKNSRIRGVLYASNGI